MSEAMSKHTAKPVWSVLYDTYQCSICRTWVYKTSEGEWKHPARKGAGDE